MLGRSSRALAVASAALACALAAPTTALALGVPSISVPKLPVSPPAPVAPVVNNATGALNGALNGAQQQVGRLSGQSGNPGSSGSGEGNPSGSSTSGGGGATPSGSTGGGDSASAGGAAQPSGGAGTSSGGGVRGASATGGGRGGDGSTAGHGRGGAGAARAAALAAAHAHGTDPSRRRPHKHASNGSGFLTRDIRTIVRVIPMPIWAVIGALILLALGFAARSRYIASRARRLDRQRHELLGDVGLLQRALLPEVPDRVGGLAVSVAYRPAEGPAAGGDFYDVLALDDQRTAIIVGDVMGHGRDALAVTALMRYSLRAYLTAGLEPRVALKVAGRALDGDPDGELTTVVAAVHDSSSGMLTYACAGHEPPIITGHARHEPVTTWSSPPLGGSLETGNRQTTVLLEPGTRVCFFTDGLVEARLGTDIIGRELLTEVVDALGPDDGASELLRRVADRAERTPDDMAACIVTACGDQVCSAPLRIEQLEVGLSELDDDRLETFLHACGVPSRKVNDAVARARRSLVGVSPVLARVTRDGDAVSVTLGPSAGATVELPALADAAGLERLAIAD